MDDILCCPICGNKLKTAHLTKKLLHPVGKTANYAQRTCSEGYNHVIRFFTDKKTKQVDFLSISLNPKYSRYLDIDYVNQKCRITCAKDGEYEYIEIPKMIFPDFPDLVQLNERVSLYVLFS
jgi:hypothetical protein